MSDVSFQEHIDGERARLESAKAELLQERRLIDERLANIEDVFRAISAYEAAKTGKAQKPAHNGAAPRAQRGSTHAAILNALDAAPAGMRRSDLLKTLGIKGDKSCEMSVSNALTKLVKTGQVTRVDGRYHVPATALREAAE